MLSRPLWGIIFSPLVAVCDSGKLLFGETLTKVYNGRAVGHGQLLRYRF